jgi:hypothetical protein
VTHLYPAELHSTTFLTISIHFIRNSKGAETKQYVSCSCLCVLFSKSNWWLITFRQVQIFTQVLLRANFQIWHRGPFVPKTGSESGIGTLLTSRHNVSMDSSPSQWLFRQRGAACI